MFKNLTADGFKSPDHPLWSILIGLITLGALALLLTTNYDSGFVPAKDLQTLAEAGIVYYGLKLAQWGWKNKQRENRENGNAE